jgi:4-amino-4-deoxy-L-arabinose transferase-like glycosyltransferase
MRRVLFCGILAVAFLLRVISLSNFPAGFNADEASFGYDAYSILHTGRDQWGNFMPLVFKSFGDYKSPVYAYLAVPSTALFGLSVFASRLPSVIAGTLAVLAIYLLVNEIVALKKWSNDSRYKWLDVTSAFILAVNPWSVMMSRGAVEANLISFFLPLGIYFFLKGLRDNKFFVWSAILLGVDLFTYHSAKLITPVVLIGLIYVFKRQLKKIGVKRLLLPLLIFLVFFIGLLYTFKIGGGSRIEERSITQGALEEGFDERMVAIGKGENSKVAKVFHNKYQVIVNRFVTNYFQYFSPKFLIQSGAGDASYAMIPGVGTIYFLEGLMLLGVIPLLFMERKTRNLILILLLWLLVTPLTAALASGAGYSGNRAGGMLPVLQIVESFGFMGWAILVKRFDTRLTQFAGLVFSVVFVFEIYNFASTYFKIQSTLVLKQEDYGSIQAAAWLESNSNGRNVLISRSLSEPQIFIAFANKWDPADFQKSANKWDFDGSKLMWVDQLSSYSLGNYTIKSIDWKTDINSNALLVVKADEFSGTQIPIKAINFPDGSPDIYIIDPGQKTYAKGN